MRSSFQRHISSFRRALLIVLSPSAALYARRNEIERRDVFPPPPSLPRSSVTHALRHAFVYGPLDATRRDARGTSLFHLRYARLYGRSLPARRPAGNRCPRMHTCAGCAACFLSTTSTTCEKRHPGGLLPGRALLNARFKVRLAFDASKCYTTKTGRKGERIEILIAFTRLVQSRDTKCVQATLTFVFNTKKV